MAAKSKTKKDRTIAENLLVFKETCEISDIEISNAILENPKVINAICKMCNSEICNSLLYQLYYIANEEWQKNVDSKIKDEDRIGRIQVSRELRNLCNEEIRKRKED